MKLIIDIPEAKYEDLKNFVPAETDEEEYIKNGVPLDEVLAKIKEEIKRMDYNMFVCDVLVNQEEVLDIIEKYKGDKK